MLVNSKRPISVPWLMSVIEIYDSLIMVLVGWKDIAGYLCCCTRTVQRWEKRGLPVHRPFGVLMPPELPLTRRRHEMLTTIVSVTNRAEGQLLAGIA